MSRARLTDEIPDFSYSVAGVLGLRAIKSLADKDRRSVEAARYGALAEVYRHRREGAVATVGPDFDPGPVYVDDDARVIVTYKLHGRIAEPQSMPIARFCAWPAAMKDAEILGVHLDVPNALAAYGKGVDRTLECSVWDARYAGQALLRRDVLRDYADLTPEGRRFADALKAIPEDEHPWGRPPDGAVVAAGTATEVLSAEAIEPSTSGDPVGWWYVFNWSPFEYIAGSVLPPVDASPRRWLIKSAITAAVSDDAYFRTRPGLSGSRERQREFLTDALHSPGRIVSPEAARAHRERRELVLGTETLTLAEFEALSDVDRAILNNIAYGRVGWQHELDTDPNDVESFAPPAAAPKTESVKAQVATHYRGGRQKLWTDITGDTAVALVLGLLPLPVAATWWPTVEQAGAELLTRLLDAGLTERQSVVLLGTQAGYTAAEVAEALHIARSTVAAHLSAGRKILKKNRDVD